MFVGYDNSKGYRVYYEDKKEVHIKRDIIFIDKVSKNEQIESEEQLHDIDLEENQGNGEGELDVTHDTRNNSRSET